MGYKTSYHIINYCIYIKNGDGFIPKTFLCTDNPKNAYQKFKELKKKYGNNIVIGKIEAIERVSMLSEKSLEELVKKLFP